MERASIRARKYGAHRFMSDLLSWWGAWRAASAAEDAYEQMRSRGSPRDIASQTAFKAMAADDNSAAHDEPVRAMPGRSDIEVNHEPGPAGDLTSGSTA